MSFLQKIKEKLLNYFHRGIRIKLTSEIYYNKKNIMRIITWKKIVAINGNSLN